MSAGNGDRRISVLLRNSCGNDVPSAVNQTGPAWRTGSRGGATSTPVMRLCESRVRGSHRQSGNGMTRRTDKNVEGGTMVLKIGIIVLLAALAPIAVWYAVQLLWTYMRALTSGFGVGKGPDAAEVP